MTDQQLPPSGQEVPPSIRSNRFSCPHCGAFAHQHWFALHVVNTEKNAPPTIPDYRKLSELQADDSSPELIRRFGKLIETIDSGKVYFENIGSSYSSIKAGNIHVSHCYACEDIAVWIHECLVFPPKRTGPQPNPDLPGDIKADYEEARSILDLSPRGAAALLRLCIEKLCSSLAASGKSLDAKIDDLAKKSLIGEQIRKALHTVRVIGNEAVHPGTMDLKDDRGTAESLFKIVNVIAEKTISEPKRVDEVLKSLPESKREAIAKLEGPSNQEK